MAKETIGTIELEIPSQWDRKTIADGAWLQRNTMQPIYDNEVTLASAISDTSAALKDLDVSIESSDDTVSITSARKGHFDLSVAAALHDTADSVLGLAKEYTDREVASEVSGKKDKQTALEFSGSATKTVKKIAQNADGVMSVEFEDIELPNDVTISSSDDSINVKDDGNGNFDLSLNIGDVDETWAHFKNDDTWYNINSTTYTDVSSGLSLAEGDLISSMSASLSAGLYFFSAELAYHSYTPEDTYQKIDLKILYGNRELRAESFNFDKAAPNGILQTEWSSGLFKLEGDGNIAIKLALGSSLFASSYRNQVKVSHFFIRKIDGSSVSGGSGGSGDNDKVAVDANSTAGYLENVLVSNSDLVSLVKVGDQLRVNVNTEYSSDPKLTTMNESQIDSSTSNYGSYALQTGATKLIWNDTDLTSYSWLNAQVYQMMRLSDGQGTITKANLALCGSMGFQDPAPCFNVGIFDALTGTLLGQSGLKYYGEDFNSDQELCTVDMTEATEGSLNIKRNFKYIVMVWTCGLQLAGLDKSTDYNYTYDFALRQNLEGTISKPIWPAITDLNARATKIPYVTFGATAI